MKRIILITLSLLIVVVPASADFIDDFNSHADFWQVNPTEQKADNTGVYYASGQVIVLYDDESVTIAGKEPVETLAVACCALDSIDQNESFEIAGRIFETYLHALKSDEKYSYSVLWSFKTKVYITIRDDIVIVSLVI